MPAKKTKKNFDIFILLTVSLSSENPGQSDGI